LKNPRLGLNLRTLHHPPLQTEENVVEVDVVDEEVAEVDVEGGEEEAEEVVRSAVPFLDYTPFHSFKNNSVMKVK
jgi:hypothetical protein